MKFNGILLATIFMTVSFQRMNAAEVIGHCPNCYTSILKTESTPTSVKTGDDIVRDSTHVHDLIFIDSEFFDRSKETSSSAIKTALTPPLNAPDFAIPGQISISNPVAASSTTPTCPSNYKYYSSFGYPSIYITDSACLQQINSPASNKTIINELVVNADGTPKLFPLDGSKPGHGVMLQWVCYLPGHLQGFENDFYSSKDQLDAAKTTIEQNPNIKVTYSGPAPLSTSGYQLQFLFLDLIPTGCGTVNL